MSLEEMFSRIGENYALILVRFRNDEKIERYLKLFIEDRTFTYLEDSMNKKDYKTAFRMVHTLKGMAINMGLSKLHDVASAMTEKLRVEDYSDIDKYYQNVCDCYNEVKGAILNYFS